MNLWWPPVRSSGTNMSTHGSSPVPPAGNQSAQRLALSLPPSSMWRFLLSLERLHYTDHSPIRISLRQAALPSRWSKWRQIVCKRLMQTTTGWWWGEGRRGEGRRWCIMLQDSQTQSSLQGWQESSANKLLLKIFRLRLSSGSPRQKTKNIVSKILCMRNSL